MSTSCSDALFKDCAPAGSCRALLHFILFFCAVPPHESSRSRQIEGLGKESTNGMYRLAPRRSSDSKTSELTNFLLVVWSNMQIIKPWKSHALWWIQYSDRLQFQMCSHKQASKKRNSMSVLQPPLAIHQNKIPGTIINQTNKVLKAIWPWCPRDMMCGILLPPKPYAFV